VTLHSRSQKSVENGWFHSRLACFTNTIADQPGLDFRRGLLSHDSLLRREAVGLPWRTWYTTRPNNNPLYPETKLSRLHYVHSTLLDFSTSRLSLAGLKSGQAAHHESERGIRILQRRYTGEDPCRYRGLRPPIVRRLYSHRRAQRRMANELTWGFILSFANEADHGRRSPETLSLSFRPNCLAILDPEWCRNDLLWCTLTSALGCKLLEEEDGTWRCAVCDKICRNSGHAWEHDIEHCEPERFVENWDEILLGSAT
jgi:hypothetical protein